MSASPMPTMFVSHGAPDIVIRDMAARDFLKAYAGKIEKPKAILVVSAHFETHGVAIVTDPKPGMTYDFGGFDPRLREIVYGAPGEPDIAERAAGLLEAAGFNVDRIASRGFDHGVWTPLALLFPDADIPVVQMSVSPDRDAGWHFALGQAIEPLRDEGVLILGSGAITHNLAAFFAGGFTAQSEPEHWVRAFADWLAERIAEGDTKALVRYREEAPFARENHPTEEHLLPLFVALGAGGAGVAGKRLHESVDHGVIAMDAYAFA
ncbi:DODA-type extradiol aromatic ring-opening family dioxygenase [Tepidamorphus sp. 3E244]|uniref:DODA-type extradiol aromatic ring-opening family dioxygenase n=1 Tax=Tepidamorphus sp. 3E244 TaxID=3385498 RepID=UPI0038FD35C3